MRAQKDQSKYYSSFWVEAAAHTLVGTSFGIP